MSQREIKFRVWHICESRYLATPDGLFFEYPSSLNGGEYIGDFIKDTDVYITEQYTGQKDKNRKEIHEGDIVSAREYLDQKCGPNIGLVEWGEYGDKEYVENLETWMIYWACKDYDNGVMIVEKQTYPEGRPTPLSCAVRSCGVNYGRGREVVPGSLEVIGSYHQNPELLT